MERAAAIAVVCGGLGCVDLLYIDGLLLPAWASERDGAPTIAAAGLVDEGTRAAEAPTAPARSEGAPALVAIPGTTTRTASAPPPHRSSAAEPARAASPPAPPQPAERLAIRFAQTGSTEVDEAARLRLEEVVRKLQAAPAARVQVDGHADARGSRKRNRELSRRRAEAVASELERAGVPPTKIAVTWSGEREPARRGRGEAVWAANRRVELVLHHGR